MAQKEARLEYGRFRYQYGCHQCGNMDPIHTNRRFQKSRGLRAPGFLIDTLYCPNCKSEWTVLPEDKEAS